MELDDSDAKGAGGDWQAELDQLRNAGVSFAASAEVGTLLGRAWSDDAGAAHYAIPLEVAPGPNGFAPSLTLQYSSQSGNGLYCMGFSVDAWGVSRATLLRVAVPVSDWEDPSGSHVLTFDDVDFPLSDPAYVVVPLEYNGDGRDDLFVCQGQGYKSSRWHLWLTRDVANTPGETYGWDVHDTGVDCSSHDELEGVNEATRTTTTVDDPNYDHANWIIASPQEIRTEDCSGVDCKTRRSAIWYQPNTTIPEQLYRNYGTPLEQVTRLEYDAHGNVDFMEVDAAGEPGRSRARSLRPGTPRG